MGCDATGPEQAIALQSIDTMTTVVSDRELAPRLAPMLPGIVTILTELIEKIAEPKFFEFVREFAKHYAQALDDKVLVIFATVARRVQADAEKRIANPAGEYPCIGKGWNVLRLVLGFNAYMPRFYEPCE